MRKLIIGAALGAMLAAGTTAAVASIPDTDGTIHACIQPQNGNVTKIIDTDAGQSCANNEQPLNWNQAGPQGPAGANGVSGYEVVSATETVPANSLQQGQRVVATCPGGKTAIGGGGRGVSGADAVSAWLVLTSDPVGTNGWRASFWRVGSPFTEDARLTAFAVCAFTG